MAGKERALPPGITAPPDQSSEHLLHSTGELHSGSAAPAQPGPPSGAGGGWIIHNESSRLSLLLAVITTVALGVGAIITVALYQVSVTQQRQRLVGMARMQARVVEAMVRHQPAGQGPEVPADLITEFLGQIRAAYVEDEGSGLTDECLLGWRQGQQIILKLHAQRSEDIRVDSVPFEGSREIPMRRAMHGESGTMIGIDYRGHRVLAAYEPMASLGMGVVTKVDLAEIRAPYLRVAGVGALATLCLAGIGAVLFHRAARPIFRDLFERELRYRALFENGADAVFVLSDRFEDCNQRACELLGCPRERIAGHFPAEFSPPFQPDGQPSEILVRQYVQDALAGRTQRLHWRYLRPDGEVRDAEVTLAAARLHGRQVVLVSAHDVTARRCAEETQRLRLAAIEASHDMIVITDAKGHIEYVNPAFTAQTGYAASQVLGRKTSILRSDQNDAALYADLWSTIHAGKVWSGQLINRRKDGSLYPEEMSITPVRGEQGQVTRFVAIKRDITRRRHDEEAQAQARQQAEAAAHSLRRQQDLLANIVRHIPHHVFWKDRNSVYLGCNPLFARGAGLGHPAQIVGKSDYDMPWTRAEADHYRACDQQVMQSGQAIIDHAESQVNAEGRQIILRTSKVPLRDAFGAVVGILGIYNDDTERTSLERQTRDQLLFLQTLLDTIPNPVFFRDLEGRYRLCNRALAEWLGRDQQELVGSSMDSVLPAQMLDIHRAKDAELIQTGGVQVFEGPAPSATGIREACFYRARVCDQDGKPSGIIGVIMDLTERRRAQAIERQTQDLQSAVQAMEQVLGVVGHELRTPLAAIRATSEFLVMDREGDPQTTQFLQSILDQSVHMAELLNNMLEAARINSGAATWQWGPVNVLGTAVDALRTVAPLAGSAVTLDCANVPADLTMSGDAAAIRRLILNLVSNAARHTRQGTIQVVADQEFGPGGRQIILQVRDTGEGIPPEVRDKLGVAFALNDGVVSVDHAHGAGLGLAICKGIAAAHGGHITVDSSPGKGATFRIMLLADLPGASACTARGIVAGRGKAAIR
ncbi:MAG: PAS domain S-box protein [Phycisphaeraceae bacterium]